MKSLFTTAIFLFGVSLFAQNTWTVDNRLGTTAQFTSVQAAIDAAEAGDFIYIHPSSINYGSITLNKRLNLRGIGHTPELANGEKATISSFMLFTNNTGITCSGSTISGLKIDALVDNNFGNISNVVIQNNLIGLFSARSPFNFVIQGNIFNMSGSVGINFTTSTHANNIISHNIFIRNTNSQISGVIEGLISSDSFNNNIVVFNNSSNDLGLFKNCLNPIVNNNIFVLNSNQTTATEILLLTSTITFQNCLTFAYGGQTLSNLNGSNNLNNTNPQFTNIGNTTNMAYTITNNYKLNTGSPAIDAGSDGDDLGIYAQGFKFQKRGYPFDLPYPTSININNALVAAGSNLEVVLKASANVEN